MNLALIRLMRPHQWTKQAIVILPLLSLGTTFTAKELILGIISFAVFSLASSVVYIFNDFTDLHNDRSDPIRIKRPLASGDISINVAFYALVFLCIAFGVLNYHYSREWKLSGIILGIYLFLNFLYSKFQLKSHNLLGITFVASGFPLRFAFGSTFMDIKISYWAITLIMELSLFMLSIKRFQTTLRSVKGNSQNGGIHDFWLLSAVIFAGVFAASYAGFVTSPDTQAIWGGNALLLSTLPIAIGMVRFIEIAVISDLNCQSDATDIVVKDIPMLSLVLLYLGILFVGRLSIG